MLIALPNTDHTFTCTLFYPLHGENSFENLITKEEVEIFFKRYFSDIVDLIPDLYDQFKMNPIGKLATVYLDSWAYKDRLCLFGDAAHAVVPFFGQGMNASFEDCTVFHDILQKTSNIELAFKRTVMFNLVDGTYYSSGIAYRKGITGTHRSGKVFITDSLRELIDKFCIDYYKANE